MTSRTPMGVQPRPPQRGIGPALQAQRSSSHQQRSIPSSQQPYPPTSPSRRDTTTAPDPSSESADVLSARHVSTPRRQGSRLRLELSNDLVAAGPASSAGSPQNLTPSRMMSLPDITETDVASPLAKSRPTQHDGDNPALPMPKRRPPSTAQFPPVSRSSAPVSASAKKDGKPKPYAIETPSAAPKYASTKRHESTNREPFSKGLFSGFADFVPWTGSHHEDEWNTEAIQKGTWDRGYQNEASSARLVMPPALKQKTGLNALSSIFTGVLAQRRQRGQIKAPSTFKPPPRVTLTDTKREIWLKDLANPAISLRRLSRTIPHGIRGRTLLDQCLNKDVPTERAVWLAKCVGANEIRAFKRKGASGALILNGELKWIRDWTVFVEQFLEATVSAFGEPEWKAKVTYAIRLATCLYAEQLLDRDHYLEWVIYGLETSSQSRLPMSILIARLYWGDLLRLRKSGRRLVFALLSHLHAIEKDPDRDILIQLSGQLSTLLLFLIKHNPESFVCPPAWQLFADTLRLTVPADDFVAQSAFSRIQSRNTKLSVANTSTPPGGRQYLVQVLDSTLQGKGGSDLSDKCWTSTEDKTEMLKTVVEWATTLHRPGLARLYVASGLIKSWGVFAIGATTAILDLLGDAAMNRRVKKGLMIRLVCELVRSGHFSVPQYLQWLIGRGGLHDAQEIDPVDGPCATRLLVDLPVHCLPEEQISQRGSLLRRAGNYSVSEETSDIDHALVIVDRALGLAALDKDVEGPRKPVSLKKLLARVKNSGRAVQSAIGYHLLDTVASRLPRQPDFVMTVTNFCSIRNVMETIEDFSMLEGILQRCSLCPNPDVLAACVDTVNANLDIFIAMGSAESLFDVFVERLKAMSRSQGVVVRSLLAALSSLAPRLPHREDLAKQLSFELAQNDRSNAIDACSPVSDSMTAQAQTAEGEVSEQIDKLLASGNIIDHPTMKRLFRYIAPKLEAGWFKLDGNRKIFASLLSRLRMLDAPHFDRLVADWISHIRTLQARPPLPELYPLLVSLGCLSTATILHTANAGSAATHVAADAPVPKSATYLQELLQLMMMTLPTTATLDSGEAYRFRIQQQIAMFENAKSFLLLVRNALVEYAALPGSQSGPDGASPSAFDSPDFQDRLMEVMRFLVVADPLHMADVLSVGSLPARAKSLVHIIVTKLLLPEPGCDCDSNPSFEQILHLANDLTMPFCQLKLNLDLAIVSSRSTDGDEESTQRFQAFTKAMDNAIKSRNMMWTSMLPCLSDDITQGLNREAHARFLHLMPSSKSESMANDASDTSRIRLAENLVGVIEAIMSGQPPSKAACLNPGLVDKLSDLWEIIASQDEDRSRTKMEVLEHWLPVLLRFITLHSAICEAPNNSATGATGATGATSTTSVTSVTSMTSIAPGAANAAKPTQTANQEARARIILVLCGILLEVEAMPPLQDEAVRSLSQHIFDVAMLLVDGLPDDLRLQCARCMLPLPASTASAGITSDPRLFYLLSISRPTSAEDLKLAHRDKSSTPGASAAARSMGAMYGIGPTSHERLTPFVIRRWEILSEPTPNVGENDTSLSLGLFEAMRMQ